MTILKQPGKELLFWIPAWKTGSNLPFFWKQAWPLMPSIFMQPHPWQFSPNSCAHSWFLSVLLYVTSQREALWNINMQAAQIPLDGPEPSIFRMLQDLVLNNLQAEKSNTCIPKKPQNSCIIQKQCANLMHTETTSYRGWNYSQMINRTESVPLQVYSCSKGHQSPMKVNKSFLLPWKVTFFPSVEVILSWLSDV